MGFWVFMLCMDLFLPLAMAAFGFVFLRWPPAEINGFYGYRTARSMASKEAWDFAHRYFGKLWLAAGLCMLPLSAVAMLPCLGRDADVVGLWGGIWCMAECVIMILTIIPTERALKKRFH